MQDKILQMKLDSEKELSDSLSPFYDVALDSSLSFFKKDNLIFDSFTIEDKDGSNFLEKALVLQYLKNFLKTNSNEAAALLPDTQIVDLENISLQKLFFLQNYIRDRISFSTPLILDTLNKRIEKAITTNLQRKVDNINSIITIDFNNQVDNIGFYSSKVFDFLNSSEVRDQIKEGEEVNDIISKFIEQENLDIKKDKTVEEGRASGSIASDTALSEEDEDDIEERMGVALAGNFEASSNRIGVTENQNSIETYRNTDVKLISGIAAVAMLKEWFTTLDGKEREWHNEAHGQVRSFNDPFLVKDELLQFPGDTSLGASDDNIINCRCVQLFTPL